MKYQEALGYIQSIPVRIAPGLVNIQNICGELSNPQKDLKFIHIAGTNGKGTVLSFVSTVLAKAGYRVGRYISPTVKEYRERFQINGLMISKRDLGKYVELIKNACDLLMEQGLPMPTPFEFETALSFLYFKEKKCDIIVMETGMGGIEDATNIIENTFISVLTPISMDHMSFLGKTLEEITAKKVGIIKNDSIVVCAKQSKEAMEVIQKKVKSMEVPFYPMDANLIKSIKYGLRKQSFSYKEYKKIEISLAGSYQIENAALSLEVVDALLEKGFQIPKQAVYEGMREAGWFGRFTSVGKRPMFILDGAHNEAGAKCLADSIKLYFPNKRLIYIMGILRDKEYEKIIEQTYQFADSILTIKIPDNARTMEAYELAQEVSKYHNHVTALDSLEEAVELSCLMADKDTVIIAFGSLSFLGKLSEIVENKQNLRRDIHGR